MTCHAGRTDPRPLPEALWAAYETEGIEGTTKRYHELRERYFGGDAYDFRVHVLPSVAVRLADQGALDDAIALMLERTIDEQGVDAALTELTKLEPTLAADVVTPELLDSLAWRLNRSDGGRSPS